MARHRVAITGLGLISPYGGDLDDFFQRIWAGESAVQWFVTDDEPRPLRLPFVRCAGFEPERELGKPQALMMERFSQLGLAAVLRAWQHAGLARSAAEDGSDRRRWGCLWGTALGGLAAHERGARELWLRGRERVSPLSVVMGMNNATNAHVSIQLGLGGVSSSHTAACASASMAIGEAFRRVRSGEAEVMVTGGSDVCQSLSVVKAWEAMRVMARADEHTAARACRPFSTERSGLVLGEGGAALVLENWDHAVARGARIQGELIGFATNCDHSHLVRPDRDGQARALRAVLHDAGLAPGDVHYVNAHGTATPEGDPIEVQSLREVFGAHAAALPVSSTKSMHGHLLGASGAIEAVITAMALREQAIPPTAQLDGHLDPACEGVDHVVQGRRGQALRVALSNSFAFGGSNVVLAFAAPDPSH